MQHHGGSGEVRPLDELGQTSRRRLTPWQSNLPIFSQQASMPQGGLSRTKITVFEIGPKLPIDGCDMDLIGDPTNPKLEILEYFTSLRLSTTNTERFTPCYDRHA